MAIPSHHGRASCGRLSSSVRPLFFFQGARRQSLLSLWSCGHCERSLAADNDVKTFAVTIPLPLARCHGGRALLTFFGVGCARGSAALIAHEVLANDKPSELTWKTSVLFVDRRRSVHGERFMF